MRLGLATVAILDALLLFHPALILEMDRSMSDSVGFSLWLAGAGGIIGFVAASREKVHYWSLGLAIASFAFAGITRSGEGPIVVVEMMAVALLSLLLFRGLDSWRRQRGVVACFCAVVANLAAAQALSAAHYVNSGYWGASPVESRQWWQLYSTLLSLPVRRDDRRVLVNKATMEIAESFSDDLRNMDSCVKQSSTVQLPNESVAWIITGCLPGEESRERYARMRTISADIIKGAHERHLELSAPVLGIIPQPAVQWLPDLPSSIIGTALAFLEIPDSTRVAQSSWQEQILIGHFFAAPRWSRQVRTPKFSATIHSSKFCTLCWPPFSGL